MKKGILTMLLTIVVLTGMILSMTLTASAAATTTDTWDGTTVDTSWHNTTDTAFTIDTAAKLAGLSSIVNAGTDNFSGDTVTLAANINLADKAWTPIGTSSTYSFKGTFDGAGYTISNLKIESTAQYVGMFGYVSVAGTIKNVVLESPDVTTSYSSANASVGALAGYCSGTGNIEYCAVRNGSVSTPSSTCASTYSGLGGVVGCHNTSGNVIGCYNYMTAVSTKDNTMTRCGGVVGSVNKMAKSCYTYNTNQKGTPVAGGYASGSGTPAQYSAYLKADGTESSSISWSSYSVALSAEEFANGTAAYYLRIGAYSEFNTVSFLWGQDVEGDTKETMPVWNGAEVYRVSYVKDVDGTGTVTQMYLNDLETKTIGGNTYRVIRNVYDWVMFSDMVNTNSGSNYPNRNWNAIVEPAGTTLDFSVLGTLAYHNGSWQDVLTIGASSNASGYYNGIFNGNGCKITGLNYSGSGSYALFGYTGTNAYISNITIENANVTTTGTSTYAVFVKENRGTVENCHVVNSTVSAPSGWAGGFAYNNYGGTIKNCSFSGSVIEELNTTVDKIQTTLESLAEKDKSLAGEIETLKTSLNTLSGSLTSLEGRVTTAESAIETLNNALEELKAVNEADAKTLGEKITALSNALEAAKTTLETTNAATKAELAAQIASARSSLRSSINKVQRNLDEAVAALEVAIADGDSALGDKIAALNTALDSAIVAYQAADSDLKTELTSKIEEADAALDAAIKQLQKDLDDAKAELNKAIADGDTELDGKISNLNDALANELDSVKNELENKTAELQTLIIVVCVISIVALCGIGAFVIWFFIDRKKRI